MIEPEQVAYINARIVDPASGMDGMGALVTFGDEIQAIGPNLFPEGMPGHFETVDCNGHLICPGLVDMRVFTGEPGAEHKETLATASQAAAAGGVTTMIVMPNTDPVIDDVALVDFILRRSRDTAIINVYPMAALTKGLHGEHLTEMGLLQEAGAVAFTDGDRSVMDARLMRHALSYAKTFGALLVHDAEDPNLALGGAMNEGELASRLGLQGIPTTAETIIVERDVALLKLTGGRYHLSQISSAETLRVVESAKAEGLDITCAVSSHHLALNENDVGDYRTFFKTAPPLRTEDDRSALVDGLAKGLIDVVVSGHNPQGPEDKRLPFAEATFGTVGLETLLPVTLELVQNGRLDLMTLIRSMTETPAKILDLPAGRLSTGSKADFILVDKDAPYVFDAATLRSKSKNSPFDERRLQGRVLKTIVSGKVVYEQSSG